MPHKLRIIYTFFLLLYLAAATAMTMSYDGVGKKCNGVIINVARLDSTTVQGNDFVTAQEIGFELDSLPQRAKGMYLSSISPQQLRMRLEKIDKVEDVSVVTMTDGTIHISITPMKPVMRVFDDMQSYYVNRSGKRLKATSHYRADVPVIEGTFNPNDTVFTPLSLLPIIDFLNSDPLWGKYFTMIRVDSPNDIVLIPCIKGHEVNIGRPDNIEEKLSRLKQFYTQVMPVKGWDYYTGLSVKYGGQLIATRRPLAHVAVNDTITEEEEAVEPGTMLAGDNVAPGQAIPGRKAHNEKPIPAAIPKSTEKGQESTDTIN